MDFTQQAEQAVNQDMNLLQLVEKLRKEQALKLDTVVPAKALKMVHEFGSPILTYESPKLGELGLAVTDNFHRQAAEKLQIPMKYYRRMMAETPELLTQNINTWLKRSDRAHMVRAFVPQHGKGGGSARALLSDRFDTSMDNINVLTGVLDALKNLRDAGEMPDIKFEQCQLTDTRLVVKISSPEIVANAEQLLRNYRRPDGKEIHGEDAYGMISGISISNSEIGRASFLISPMAMVSACANKMIYREKGLKRFHTGSQLAAGIEYQADTLAARHDWIKGETRDVVQTFLSEKWLSGTVQDISKWNIRLDHPVSACKNVAKHLGYSDTITDQLVDFFMQGGDPTAFGITQAITWAAHSAPVERQFEMEDTKNCLHWMQNAKKFDYMPVEAMA